MPVWALKRERPPEERMKEDDPPVVRKCESEPSSSFMDEF